MRLIPTTLVLSAAFTGVLLQTGPAAAEVKPSFGPHDIKTLFFISKSDDKNHLEYGMRLDDACAPSEKDAVFPYWRVFEKTPPVPTVMLSVMDYIPYGISSQRLISKSATGSEYFLRLKAVKRDIYITTTKGADGRCTSVVRITMAGQDRAELLSVHVQLKRPMSVEYLDIHGKDQRTGQPLEERVTK